MASFGKFDDSEFQKFAKQFDSAINGDVAAKIMEQSMKKAIILVLNGVKKRTPADNTLRDSWSASSLKQKGKEMTVEIVSPIKHAASVEYGQQPNLEGYASTRNTQLGKSYIPGQFMLTNTINDVQDAFDKIAAKAFEEYLEKIMGE